MRIFLILFLTLTILSFPLVVKLEGYTTSDWTDITFNGIVNDGTVVEYSGNGSISILIDGVSLHKPQFDDSTSTFSLILDVSPSSSTPTLVIKKGDIGETHVKIWVEIAEKEFYIGEYVNSLNREGDPTNEKVFEISLERLSTPSNLSKAKDFGLTDYLKVRHEDKRLVLAFYYAWYGIPEGPLGSGKYKHWYGPGFTYQGTDHPLMGLYDSWDEKTLKKHMEMAYRNGIDGFVVSWWGQGSYEADTVQKMLRIAEDMKKRGEDFYITVYYEGYDWMTKDEALSDLEYILENYTSSDRFLRYRGAPVVFIYSRTIGGLRREDWEEIVEELTSKYGRVLLVADTLSGSFAKIFGAMHTYNVCGVFRTLEKILAGSRLMALDARRSGVVFVMNVMPGYDDTHIRVPGFKVDRMGGKLYEEMWKEVLLIDPDMVVITSWNEWHEGTEIEPSEEYGWKFLELTKKWARLWKERNEVSLNTASLRSFFRSQYVEEAGLLRASVYIRPDNHRIYVASDNLIARYALELLGDPLANDIGRKLEEFGGGYNGKHDVIVFKEISGNFYQMYNEFLGYVWSKKFGRMELLYEKPDLHHPITFWREFADLVAYASMNELLKSNIPDSIEFFQRLLEMWDGCGLRDSSPSPYYQTYKTALMVLCAKRLYRVSPRVVREHLYDLEKALHILLKTQDVEGGFTVGYECQNGDVVREDDMNTETTGIAAIAVLEE